MRDSSTIRDVGTTPEQLACAHRKALPRQSAKYPASSILCTYHTLSALTVLVLSQAAGHTAYKTSSREQTGAVANLRRCDQTLTYAQFPNRHLAEHGLLEISHLI